MKILFIGAECAPFIKVGGLSEVIGSLPQALMSEGIEVRVILPKYDNIPYFYKERMTHIRSATVSVGWRNMHCELWRLHHDQITYYFVENGHYFNRAGIYGYGDDAERFAFFNRAVMELLPYLDFQPDILHANDWHTGLISLYLKDFYRFNHFYQNMRTVFTIHNLMYQGAFHKGILGDVLGLGHDHLPKIEHDGQVNFMKAALVYSDRITTVSQTYAQEIQTPNYGERLDGILHYRRHDLYGIKNGIDYEKYNPYLDHQLFENYANKDQRSAKWTNKLRLQEMFHLNVYDRMPMISIISRLVEPKGLDLVTHILDEMISLNIQVVIMGTGEHKYEQFFRDAAHRYPDKVAALITFDEGLSRKIYASSDFFLMPSRFEPCGIAQLIALRYGAVPIVRETGGLKETITPFNIHTGQGNGFSFGNYNAHDLLHTIKYALHLYYDDYNWNVLKNNINNSYFKWEDSARAYKHLYYQLLHS
jgi:starch synthase